VADETGFQPDWATPPAETIRRALIRRGWTVADLARAMEVEEETASSLVEGGSEINEFNARGLAAAFDTSADFWTERQRQYSNDVSRLKETNIGKAWLRELPLRDMLKFGWIKPYQNDTQKITGALQFFGVSDLAEWKSKYRTDLAAAAFRKSLTFTSNPVATAAWLRWANLQASAIECNAWSPGAFQSALQKMRALTRRKQPEQFVPELRRLCADSGVALVIARAPEGCRASGATRFVLPSKAMIVMSFRYRSDDHFWFTFFHEAAHLLLHGNKALFLEDGSEVTSDEENEANEFASALLIPPSSKREFEQLGTSAKGIIRFAMKEGVSPGVVVGQLQHQGRLAHNRLNRLKRRYVWSDSLTGSVILGTK
jgi:HTH-type transcriptional regulator/antitoxin HigA